MADFKSWVKSLFTFGRSKRKAEMESEILDDLPTELFSRLVGLFNTIPKIILTNPKYQDNADSFRILENSIKAQLAGNGKGEYIKTELGNQVHNLYLLLIGVLPIEHLEANIENIRSEYLNHVDETTYKAFLNNEIHVYVDKYSREDKRDETFNKDAYEERLRAEYKNLVNENRRAKLAEQHIEVTRGYLLRQTVNTYGRLIILPCVVLAIYIIITWIGVYTGKDSPGMLGAIYHTFHAQTNTDSDAGKNGSRITNINPQHKGNESADAENKNYEDSWFNACILISIFALAAVAGATGSLISVILRIQGVRDNNKLAQNMFAFKYSVIATKNAPVTGMVFALVLTLLFAGHIVSGSVFPFDNGNMKINVLVFDFTQISKWILWSFIAGFSERLVPDMVDRVAEKANKAEKT